MKARTRTGFWVLAIVACWSVLLPVSGSAQPLPQGRALDAEVDVGAWGIADGTDVRFGQIGLLSETDGPRLVVYELGTEGLPWDVSPDDFVGTVPPTSDGRLIVSRFDRGNRNSLGGTFNGFSGPPAVARARLGEAPDGSRALRVQCAGAGSGFCGAWIHLFDSRLPPLERRFLDARQFSALAFEIWTAAAPESWLLSVADARWELREDAPPIAPISELITPEREADGWRRVILPLDRLDTSVDRSLLASVIVRSLSHQQGALFIRNLLFLSEPDALGHVKRPSEAQVGPGRPTHTNAPLAVWIWHTEELLSDPRAANTSVDYLADRGVDAVFLQIPNRRELRGLPGERSLEVERLRPLLASFHEAGIRVYALDGAPEFVSPEYHRGIVQTVRNVGDYNAVVSASERFHGVRYDIEPYLLPGFRGPSRPRILADLLSLTEQIVEVAHQSGLIVGMDIPFWYDQPDERTFRSVDVEWKGVVRPASQHLIDLVDDVAIMAYRTVAYGADGTIAHSEDELRFAASRNKPIFVGIETGPLPDEVLLEFGDRPREGFPQEVSDRDRVVATQQGESLRLTLIPAGTLPDTVRESVPTTRMDSAIWWPVERRISVPAAKLTFAGLGPDRLTEVLSDTAFELSDFSSFAGFAIHDLIGWERLLGDHDSPVQP